ncbi:MAG TPA: hypothetical protein VFJ64_06590 [Solirubrobacterales bacterium]|nr:hypothetical protein [Solirubrobacterales bacterium]
MKPIKMLGLVALAALMAMAFLGAGSAMAESTELCGLDPGTAASAPCPNGVDAVIHVHETSVGKAILLASPKIECNVLFLGGVVVTGSPLVIEGNFTYSSCGSGCTFTEEGGPSVIEVLRTGHETAREVSESEIHSNCLGINCFYNFEGLVGTAKGPLLSTAANGEVSIQEQTLHKTKGTFCPATGKLDIKTTPLEPTYIGKGGAAHACVEYEHANKGFYTDAACTTLGAPFERNYRYMLVVGPGNSGECYHQILEPRGLWKDSSCTQDDTNNASLYEKVK